MEIRFIGQSCFFVKKNNTIIVTDPWCKESKAFYGAWIPFPYDDTKFLLDYDFSDKSLYIFLSHEHSDHLDIKLLKKLFNKNKNLNFLLPNFGNHCFNQVKKNFNQHKIIFLNDNEEKEINEVKFRILLEKPLFNEHGACIIEDENTIFVNSNDSVIEDFSIKKDTKKTIIYTGQFSSVSPYPDNSELVQKNQRAMHNVKLLEDNDFFNFKLSVKSSDVFLTVKSYRKLAELCNYPLHLGITEAGGLLTGSIKSSIGIGQLLMDGIGDTIRVSLSSDPVDEIKAGYEILKSLGIRSRGVNIISCPSCARQAFPVIETVKELEKRLSHLKKPITLSIIGCVVNGPGEAAQTEIGLTGGGQDSNLLYLSGVPHAKVASSEIIDKVVKLVEEKVKEKK